MATNAINNSAGILLQGGQMYQNANSKIFDAISEAAAMYEQSQARKQAQLAAERMKQMEIGAQKAKEAAVLSRDPQAILAKALQNGPESLSPQERAVFEANQKLESSKVALDALGRPYNPQQPVSLDGLPAAMVAPGATPPQPSAAAGILAPPRVDGAGGTADQYAADLETPAPVGNKPERTFKDNTGIAGTDFGKMERMKTDLKVFEEGAKADAETQRDEKKLQFGLQKQFKGLMSDFDNISSKVDRAISQSSKLNTGALAGQETGGEGTKTTGKGKFGSGYVTGGVDLNNTLKTIEADSAFSALQNMRDNSPTGGALGGIAVRELELLGAAKQSLDQSQSETQLDENLKNYKTVRQNALRNVAEAYKDRFGAYPDGYDAKKYAAPEVADAVTDKLKAAGFSGAQIEAYKRSRGIK